MRARPIVAPVLPLLFLLGELGPMAPGALAAKPGASTGTLLPTGQRITPTAARGAHFQALNPGLADFPDFTVGQAVATVLSPDQKTLLILTSGYNRNRDPSGTDIPRDSNEYVLVFDLSGPTPAQRQVLQIPNTFLGIAFAPDGSRFYVGGGLDDDVHEYIRNAERWVEATLPDGGPRLASLGHECGNGLQGTGHRVAGADQVTVPSSGSIPSCKSTNPPGTAGLAVTADGTRLVVANHANDSISILDLRGGAAPVELDLRPGKNDPSKHGVAGGEYPLGVAIRGSTTAYVTSARDREVVVVDLAAKPAIKGRIAVRGNPNALLLNRDQSRLFVASDNSDLVTLIRTVDGTIQETISTTAPQGVLPAGDRFNGSAPNNLALSPDEKTLYATNGGTNSVAVISVAGDGPHRVLGLIPTGWYPHAVAAAGGRLYVVNGKNVPGPNRGNCAATVPSKRRAARCISANQHPLQTEKAGFLTLPVPTAGELAELTAVVAKNNGFSTPQDPADQKLFAELRKRIQHVIYVVKENRTYDQVLGDLREGNGDPSLVEFGQATTPNLHALARAFVTLDDFYDSGEVSMNGWPWSTAARESDIGVKTTPVNYARRGYTYDVEGQNRDVNVGIADPAARLRSNPALNPDPDLLPGTNDLAAPDAPDALQQGYLWDAALRAGLSVRNYGFFVDLTRYAQGTPVSIPLLLDPAADGGTVVAYASNPSLAGKTDPYFRAFDNRFPDFYREKEWEREFDGYVDAGALPNLELVWLMHDHMGSFGEAIAGVNTPELQVADNDYAAGLLVQKVAHSPFAGSTLIFMIEDDAQNGPDHVDAHRSIAFVAGPYVKHGRVVSQHYTTVSMLRTIEDVLGLQHLNVNDAYQRPMSEVFDLTQERWSFTAKPSPLLLDSTTLPIATSTVHPEPVEACPEPVERGRTGLRPTHDAAYWAGLTEDFDFSAEDRLDSDHFNRILWQGLRSEAPYPTARSGVDLRRNRSALLREVPVGRAPTPPTN